MTILSIQPVQVGLVGVRPGFWSIRTNDTVGTVVADGYLTKYYNEGFSFLDGDLAAVITTTTPSATDLNTGWYQINNNNGVWSLSVSSGPGNVTLPTVANHLAVYTNATGSLSQDSTIAINGGSLQAGTSGTSGTLISYPSTASKGSLIVSAVANAGNTNVTISNASHGQASTYSIPDGGQTNSNFVISNSAGTQTIATGSLALTSGNFTATAGNIQAGSSGSAGFFRSFPAAAASGSLTLAAVTNGSGNFSTTISNSTTVAQNQTITIPNAGNTSANFLIGSAPFINGNLPMASGTAGAMVDSGVAASSIVTPSDVVLLNPASTQTITVGSLIINNGNLQAGHSGAAGAIICFPPTANKGSLILASINNASGNFVTAVSNAGAVGQSQTITIPDSGKDGSAFILADATTAQTLSTGLTFNGSGSPTNVSFQSGCTMTIGSSGFAGTVTLYPSTAANGSFAFVAANAGGDFKTTVTNGTQGQNTLFTIPDAGGATGQFLVKAAAFVNGNVPMASGTAGLMIDSGLAANNIITTTATNTMAVGSAIILSKSDGTEAGNSVTASGVAGVITTSSLTTAAAGSYVITWTNTKIIATSVIGLCIQGGTNTTNNVMLKCVPGSGTATLTIYNNAVVPALNGTILIGYTVF